MPRCQRCGKLLSFMEVEGFEGYDVCKFCKNILERNKAETEYFEAKKRKLDEE